MQPAGGGALAEGYVEVDGVLRATAAEWVWSARLGRGRLARSLASRVGNLLP